MQNGDVAAVINSLSSQLRDLGKTAKIYPDTHTLLKDCRMSILGTSPCYGAIIFHSSPSESTSASHSGIWNYTIRSPPSGGSLVDVRNDQNILERDILPLQRAVDAEIVRQSKGNNTSQDLPTADVIVYTDRGQKALDSGRTSTFLLLAIYVFGALFVFTLVDIVYHMTAFVTKERELGMTGLIDTMISGGSSTRGRVVRQISTYVSFVAVYFPSWLAVGIVISVVMFPQHSRGLPVGFLILSGLSFASYSLLGASFFKKAQMSGAIMAVIIVVGAILPVVIFNQTKATCAILSILFPSSNLSYFLTGIALFEFENKRVDLSHFELNNNDTRDQYRLPLFFHLIIAVVHIVLLPVLAFLVEQINFSTASQHRRFTSPSNAEDPTVTITGLSKTCVLKPRKHTWSPV